MVTSTSSTYPSSKFLTTKGSDPCPICGDIKGKCRRIDKLHLCMSVLDVRSTPPGFKFVGLTKDRLWGKFVSTSGNTDSWNLKAQWQSHQYQKRKRKEQEAQRQAQALSVETRDDYYRQLLKQLILHPADRLELLHRGLTDAQIEAWGVKSVEQWQKLDRALQIALPGVGLDGWSLNCQDGYLCPISDVQGYLVGFQLRLRNAKDGGRYRWLTSLTQRRPDGSTPHLPNGELPLAVHRPKKLIKGAIALVEGVGAKPFITAERQGCVVVGAAGGQFAGSPQTLKLTIDTLAQELETQMIEFYPDAGAINNRQVMRQYRSTWKLLEQWGYEIQVAWWGQLTKDSPDIDELEDRSTIQWLSIDQFEALAQPTFDWLERIQRTLQKRQQPIQSAIAVRALLGEQEVAEYTSGQRLAVWKTALDRGYRYILDMSPPGSGKSYDAGQVEPTTFGVKQVIYASDQHRNPTVSTLKQENGWVDLEARHGGLVQESTLGGTLRLKRMSRQETPTVAANCSRQHLLNTLRLKHVHGANTASLICSTCPLKEPCTHATGSGYGFLHQRQAALSSSKLRAHLDSLPDPIDYSLSNTLLLVDEPGQNFRVKQDVTVTLQDLEQTSLRLIEFPSLFQALQPLLTALIPLLNGSIKQGKFGIAHGDLVEQLPRPTIDLEALTRVLSPDMSFLNSIVAYDVDLADLPRELRKAFSKGDAELADLAKQRVLKQWLPDLLQILNGAKPGASLRLGYDGITLSLPDPRHRSLMRSAKATVFLDATLNPLDLALKLGCSVTEIFVCQQSVLQPQNLTLIQVTDLGRMGMQRGADQQRRAAEIVAHYQQQTTTTKVIDFKKFASEGTGYWWRDSRGINDFEHTNRLILIGTPCRNLADLQAEYGILVGQYPQDEDIQYRAFVNRSILSEFHQAIGRLRAHRRTDTPLEIVLLSDFDLDCPTKQVKASEISLNASSKRERFLLAVQSAIEQLKATGTKITQRAIAALIPYSQQYISQHWKLLQMLLDSSNSKTSQTSNSDAVGVSVPLASVLEEAISRCENSTQVLETVTEIFYESIKPVGWLSIWQHLPGKTQIEILKALILTLPMSQIDFLEQALE